VFPKCLPKREEGGYTYKFDSHLLAVEEVCSFENDTKRSLPDFLAYTIVDTHYI
jgi:hypothetical protein